MKEMCRIISSGGCPSCGHRTFIVVEGITTAYATDKYGSIVDSMVIDENAMGQCRKCGATFKMIPIPDGFIPETKLRSLLYATSPHYVPDEQFPTIPNPMEVSK